MTIHLAAQIPSVAAYILARIIFDRAAELARCGTGVTEVVEFVRASPRDRAETWALRISRCHGQSAAAPSQTAVVQPIQTSLIWVPRQGRHPPKELSPSLRKVGHGRGL